MPAGRPRSSGRRGTARSRAASRGTDGGGDPADVPQPIRWDSASRATRAIQSRARFEQSLARRERVFGAEHHKTANAAASLARVLVESDPRRAGELASRALRVTEATLGPSHPRVAELLLLARCDPDAEERRARLERAHCIARDTLGDAHPLARECAPRVGSGE